MNESKLSFNSFHTHTGDCAGNRFPVCNRNFSGPFLLSVLLLLTAASVPAQTIGNHPAVYDQHGILLPWTSWRDGIEREVNWYLNCPVEHGYPHFVYMTFMDGNYKGIGKHGKGSSAVLPATQNGMGIISYLKYYAYKGKKDPRLLQMARYMGDYLVKEDNTPDTGKYPRFTRSSGWRDKFPQPPDCGSMADLPYETQPDKAGIAGFALMLLYEETQDEKYLQQALHNARVLVTNMIPGTATNSPWPFRVDYRTGEAHGEVSSNMSYILRLFDKLLEHGYKEFQPARDQLWKWIKTFQIRNLAHNQDGMLWVQFFEDQRVLTNRNAMAPLNLARYLIERKEALDPDWQADARACIEFVNRNFKQIYDGIMGCGEQDTDHRPWGGINSNYGAVLALYSKATGSNEYKGIAYQALNYAFYAINDDGCPADGTHKGAWRGGWQEDAHTDKLHNFIDVIIAFPDWAN